MFEKIDTNKAYKLSFLRVATVSSPSGTVILYHPGGIPNAPTITSPSVSTSIATAHEENGGSLQSLLSKRQSIKEDIENNFANIEDSRGLFYIVFHENDTLSVKNFRKHRNYDYTCTNGEPMIPLIHTEFFHLVELAYKKPAIMSAISAKDFLLLLNNERKFFPSEVSKEDFITLLTTEIKTYVSRLELIALSKELMSPPLAHETASTPPLTVLPPAYATVSVPPRTELFSPVLTNTNATVDQATQTDLEESHPNSALNSLGASF